MAPRSLRLPITAMQVGTVAMLMRSVALDRWITVAACLVLLGASAAAARGRTWGVSVAFAVGIVFFGICALGIAPPMFAVLGLLAVRPFARMFPHFLRFDRGAAILLTALAAVLGGAAAVAWKSFAYSLFAAFPVLTPSFEVHHGVVVALIGAVASFAGLVSGRGSGVQEAKAEPQQARVRVAEMEASADGLEDDVEDEQLAARRRG